MISIIKKEFNPWISLFYFKFSSSINTIYAVNSHVVQNILKQDYLLEIQKLISNLINNISHAQPI